MKKILLALAVCALLGCEEGVCIVSGNKLGSMGKPVSFQYEGKTYKVCCAPCIKKFNKNPEKYLNDSK
ncbi:YHS domain-containing protein [bacterium]|nr:YHS domain-containing protein [bacterium]